MYGHTYYGPRAWIAVPQLLIPLSPIHAQEDALAIQPEYQLPSDVGFGTGAVNSQDPLDPNRVGVRAVNRTSLMIQHLLPVLRFVGTL
jgi:hypothetical protein